jgi:hypothetical protein
MQRCLPADHGIADIASATAAGDAVCDAPGS